MLQRCRAASGEAHPDETMGSLLRSPAEVSVSRNAYSWDAMEAGGSGDEEPRQLCLPIIEGAPHMQTGKLGEEEGGCDEEQDPPISQMQDGVEQRGSDDEEEHQDAQESAIRQVKGDIANAEKQLGVSLARYLFPVRVLPSFLGDASCTMMLAVIDAFDQVGGIKAFGPRLLVDIASKPSRDAAIKVTGGWVVQRLWDEINAANAVCPGHHIVGARILLGGPSHTPSLHQDDVHLWRIVAHVPVGPVNSGLVLSTSRTTEAGACVIRDSVDGVPQIALIASPEVLSSSSFWESKGISDLKWCQPYGKSLYHGLFASADVVSIIIDLMPYVSEAGAEQGKGNNGMDRQCKKTRRV
ncbi:hypothetical protein ACK3TF_001102 [Chlorella vulgaris]